MNAKIEISRDAIAAFCQRNHIRRMAFFGSVLRDDFGPESDVDVLVEFEPGTSIGYMGLMRLEIELGEILGRKTDLHTFEGVEDNPNWLLREEILNSAEELYEQTQGDLSPGPFPTRKGEKVPLMTSRSGCSNGFERRDLSPGPFPTRKGE